MEFVKVRHPDGRSADITEGEIPMYRSIGFDPVDGHVQTLDGLPPSKVAAPLLPAANGTDQRLDLVIEELRAIRASLDPGEPGELVPGDLIELQGYGNDELLTQVLNELRGLRADLNGTTPAEPADGEPIELREPSTSKSADPPAMGLVNLDQMNRNELNAHATAIGVPDPSSFANKSTLIEAIKAANPTQP